MNATESPRSTGGPGGGRRGRLAACSSASSTAQTGLGGDASPHLRPLGPPRAGRLPEVDRGLREGAPGITVTIVQSPTRTTSRSSQPEFTSGSGPDMFWVNTPWLATWIKEGLMTNLAPNIATAHINMSQYIRPGVAAHLQGRDLRAAQGLGHYRGLLQRDLLRPAPHPGPRHLAWNTASGGSFLHTSCKRPPSTRTASTHVARVQPGRRGHLRRRDRQRPCSPAGATSWPKTACYHPQAVRLDGQLRHPQGRPGPLVPTAT